MKRLALITGSAWLAAPAAALADVAGPGQDAPLGLPTAHHVQVAAATGAGGSLIRTFIALAAVVAVIYGVYWVLRQVKRSREERAHGHGLQTEAVVPLGPNRSLHLVRAGRELVLVGVAEQGVVPIRTYSEEEATAVGLLDSEQPPGDRPGAGGSGARPGVAALLDALRQRTVRG